MTKGELHQNFVAQLFSMGLSVEKVIASPPPLPHPTPE